MLERFLVSAIGTVVEINASGVEAEAQGHIAAAWASARVSAPRLPDGVVQVQRVGDEREMLANLAADVVRAAREESVGELWVLRAGTVVDADGRTVVVCGSSPPRDLGGSGSTMNGQLSVVVDGVVGIDTTGGVIPIPIPPSSSAGDGLKAVPPAALRLAKIVFLDCTEDGPDDPQVEVLDSSEAVASLIEASVQLCATRAPLRTIVAILSATGDAVRIRCRDVNALGVLLVRLMGQAHTEIAVPTRRVSLTPIRRPPGAASLVFRGETVDSCPLTRGRMALLKSESTGNGQLRILNELESAVWRAADGVELHEIVDRVLQQQAVRSEASVVHGMAEVVVELTEEGWLVGAPVWQIADEIAWVSSGVQATVLNLIGRDQVPMALEGSAYVVWEVLARSQPMSEGAIIEETAAHFEVEEQEVAEGVVTLLNDLASAGAVHHV